jgi:predicted metalloprotease with PDZ domain
VARYEARVHRIDLRSWYLSCLLAGAAAAQTPVVYTIQVPAPEQHKAQVQLIVPTDQLPSIDLWMGVWSPGFYRVEDPWRQVESLHARTPDGNDLAIEQPKPNHWRVATGGAAQIVVDYRIRAGGMSVTGDLISSAYGIFNGVASYVTWDQAAHKPHEVHLELPSCWPDSATALAVSPDGKPHHYRAPDFDTLVDSPIVAGTLQRFPFVVAGSQHVLVDFGDVGDWDGAMATKALQPILAEHARFFGKLPYDRYLFLNVFGPGGGGLEHKDCTLISADKRSRPDDLGWLAFVSHEYFHAFNVKRLRPVELGPFDYEVPPRTASLWIAEGLTSYYGELAVARAGVGTRDSWLGDMSSHIRTVQTTPGRLVMTLEQASLDVWTTSMSGVMGSRDKTISYYEKGPVVGWLLDAAIRAASDDHHSLDDVMRLTYQRFGGAHGYTEAQWEAAASEVAGTDLAGFFAKAIRSVDELDYAPALEWFGLQFPAPPAGKPERWQLQVLPAATAAQAAHLAHLLAPTKTK